MRASREDVMADGLILLGFIAIVTAVVTARVRRRMGFPVRPGFYTTAITAIVIIVLVVWVAHGH
jgi:hypothetical protein